MKKVLCIILALVISFSCLVPAFAETKEGCSCGFSPVIYVGPLGCADIVRNAGKDDEQKLWKTDTDFLLSNVKDVLGDLAKGLLGDTDTLGDALVTFVNASFGDLALDSEGKSRANVTVEGLSFPDSAKHGPDEQFYFNYDFRLDPAIHADRLQTCIEKVKELTGHDKVQLKASSMGGVVLAAYLQKYGWGSVETIICQCCPLWGTAVAGELFCGKLQLDATTLRQYAQDAIPYLDGSDFLQGLLFSLTDTLRIAGVWKGLIALGDDLIEKLGERIYKECLIPIFGSMPGIWSFVPAEYYENALTFMGVDKSTVLYNQIDTYRTYQANVASNLQRASADGVKIYIFCGYNVQRTPLVSFPAAKNSSDGTVDTKYASLGATCAYRNETLSGEYVSSLTEKKYLSPDGMIDASTCALPDFTWFNRGWLHCNGQDAIGEFYKTLLTSKEQITVFSLGKYPQFLENDKNAVTLTPVKGAPDAKEAFNTSRTFLNFIRLISSYIDRIIAFLGINL